MPTPKFEETMCCGHKRCPHVSIFEDGSMVVSDDETGEPVAIKFTPEQALRLLEVLKLQVGG